MGGRRWGRSGRAYGVHVDGSRHVVTPSCLKRAGLSRKVRNAGQRDAQLYPPIRVCAPPSLSISSSISFPPGRGGGRAREEKKWLA